MPSLLHHLSPSYAFPFHYFNISNTSYLEGFYILGLPSNVFFQLVLISWIVTLSACLIWQIISFILPPSEYGCVYAWTTLGSGPAIDLQKKQNCRIWLTDPKRVTVWCGFWYGFWSRGINWAIFLGKWARGGCYIVIVPCWMNFCSQKVKRRI